MAKAKDKTSRETTPRSAPAPARAHSLDVRATKPLFYGLVLQPVGAKFTLDEAADFQPTCMARADGAEPEVEAARVEETDTGNRSGGEVI